MLDTIYYVIQNNLIAGIVLMLITCGVITEPGQLLGNVNKMELKYLSGLMEIENGNPSGNDFNDINRLLLTGSVPLNRIASSNWKGNTIEEIVLAKDGGFWQYAEVTRKGFKSKKASKRTKLLAKYLLLYGPVCPSSVMYQGQSKNGSGVYVSVPVKGEKDELFCYE